jgi:hypothetical protein
MAFNTKLPIVTDGLIFSIDPYNTKSYVSGSTTAYGLTKDKEVGTLVNGVTYDDSWGFNGTNQEITINTGFGVNPPSLPITIDFWVYVPNGVSNGGWVALDTNSTNYYGVSIQGSGTNQASLHIGDGGGTGTGNRKSIVTVSTIPTDEWVHITAIYRNPVGNDISCYINTVDAGGTPDGSGGAIAWSSDSSARTRLGESWGLGSFYGEVFISQVNVYNKELSSDEMSQNHNALKYRFV